MGFVQDNLTQNEKIIYEAKLHWAMFITPVLFILLGILLTVLSFAGGENNAGCLGLSWAVILLGVIAGISSGLSYATSEFALTNKKVIAKVGFIRRQSIELMLQKIESVNISQPIMGRMLGYGTITVTGTGGVKTPFKNITDPIKLKNQIQNQIPE